MRKLLALLVIFAAACGGHESPNRESGVSRSPISVRGWVADVAGSPSATYRTAETEAARKMSLWAATNVWIEGAPYISGGVAENGSFILLDVPPGNVTVSFAAPGAPDAKLVLQNVPGNADVYLGPIQLKPGGVDLLDLGNAKVRLAAKIDQPRPTGKTALVAGKALPIVETPMKMMTDRLDFPTPPPLGGGMATVR
jgi:hypothetical protein